MVRTNAICSGQSVLNAISNLTMETEGWYIALCPPHFTLMCLADCVIIIHIGTVTLSCFITYGLEECLLEDMPTLGWVVLLSMFELLQRTLLQVDVFVHVGRAEVNDCYVPSHELTWLGCVPQYFCSVWLYYFAQTTVGLEVTYHNDTRSIEENNHSTQTLWVSGSSKTNQ